jgi:hypothetical protein
MTGCLSLTLEFSKWRQHFTENKKWCPTALLCNVITQSNITMALEISSSVKYKKTGRIRNELTNIMRILCTYVNTSSMDISNPQLKSHYKNTARSLPITSKKQATSVNKQMN